MSLENSGKLHIGRFFKVSGFAEGCKMPLMDGYVRAGRAADTPKYYIHMQESHKGTKDKGYLAMGTWLPGTLTKVPCSLP